MSSELSSFSSAIIGAIIGGLITGFFTIKSTNNSFDNQKKQSEESEKAIIKGLLQSIHDEVDSIYERYHESMGILIESLEDDKPLAVYYPLSSDFFTVYNGNSFLIGRIQDHSLRKQIIRTYTIAKGIVDSFKMNNELVAKFEISNKIFQETNSEVHKNQANTQYFYLVEYAKVLKEAHIKLKNEVNHLLEKIKKQGILDN